MTVLSGEDPAVPMVSENEAWYDAEIAPALEALAKRCEERGMGFLAEVEFEPNRRGGTHVLLEGSGMAMRMLHVAACTLPNVDSFVLAIYRLAQMRGEDISRSFVLSALKKE